MKVWVMRNTTYEIQDRSVQDGVVGEFRWLKDSIASPKLKDIENIYQDEHPDDVPKRVAIKAGEPFRFAGGERTRNGKKIPGMKKGDWIILSLKNNKDRASGYSYVGIIAGDYEYSKRCGQFWHQRQMDWKKELPNSEIPHHLTNLGKVSEISDPDMPSKLSKVLEGEEVDVDISDREDKDSVAAAREDIRSFIKEHFSGHSLSKLVGAILEAMGYKCKISPEGPDKGIDIYARLGELGDTLCVQVKNTSSQKGSPDLDQFKGAMSKKGEKGIYVSWGGFGGVKHESNLRDEYFDSMQLWNSDDVLRLIDEHYEKFSNELKQKFPLRRVLVVDLQDNSRDN